MIVLAVTRSKAAAIIFSASAGIMYSTLFTMPYMIIAHYHATGRVSATYNHKKAPTKLRQHIWITMDWKMSKFPGTTGVLMAPIHRCSLPLSEDTTSKHIWSQRLVEVDLFVVTVLLSAVTIPNPTSTGWRNFPHGISTNETLTKAYSMYLSTLTIISYSQLQPKGNFRAEKRNGVKSCYNRVGHERCPFSDHSPRSVLT
jgi:hypothetical protein